MVYNILGSLFSLIYCLYNEGSLVYFRQIPNSAEVIYEKQSDLSKFVFVIMLSRVKDASESKHLPVIFHILHQIFKHNHNQRQRGSLFGKPDWKLKVLMNF